MKKILLLLTCSFFLFASCNKNVDKEEANEEQLQQKKEEKAAKCYNREERRFVVEPEYLHEYYIDDMDMRVVLFSFDNYDDYSAEFFSNGKNSMYGAHLRQFMKENPDLVFQSSCPSVPDEKGKGKGYITYWKKKPKQYLTWDTNGERIIRQSKAIRLAAAKTKR